MLLQHLVSLLVLCQKREIEQLPGVSFELNFKHYSGFFRVSYTHFLHYWFVESQNEPKHDPLIFWFNGGPGCSSLGGLLTEMGPYLVTEDGRNLRPNQYSWNKFASVVYIESPAGVGYSCATDGNTTTNDDQTSLENYEAVKQFFRTFPEFQHHDTYIMGESYGGVYVPTLTARIVAGQKEFPINLKGIAIGNGLVDNEELMINTLMRLAYFHGIVDENIWSTIRDRCCDGDTDFCNFIELTDVYCVHVVEDIYNSIFIEGLNPYDIYRDCDINPATSENMTHVHRGGSALYTTMEQFRKKGGNLIDFIRANHPPYGGDMPCMNDSDIVTYMNDAQVRKALNIPLSLPRWKTCSSKVSYQRQRRDTAPLIKHIIDANVRVLLYYGDTDMVCNFMMGQQFADQLGLQRGGHKTSWKYNSQIAGFKTLYEGLTFLTVKGAGHLAPRWKAPQMYYAIQQFVLNESI